VFLIVIPLSFPPFRRPLLIFTLVPPFSRFQFHDSLFLRPIINALSLLSSFSFTLKHFIVLDDWSRLVDIVRNYVLCKCWKTTLPARSKFSTTADINQLKLTKILIYAVWIAYSNVVSIRLSIPGAAGIFGFVINVTEWCKRTLKHFLVPSLRHIKWIETNLYVHWI
jgi:hypothetical protein